MPHELAYILQQALNALQLTALYLPLALSFALVQAMTGRMFLGLGDFAMYGSFAAIYVCFDAMTHGFADLNAGGLALLAALSSGAALGFAVARLMLGKTLLQAPLAFMIASIGLAIVVMEVMRLQSNSKDIWVPPLLPGERLAEIDGSFPIRIATLPLFGIGVAALAAIAVLYLINQTSFGRNWRATAQSPQLAALCAVDPHWITQLTFALAGSLAGVTGWTSAIVYGGANFSIGLMTGFKAMFASVIGGFGTLRGAALGAAVLATLEVVWSAAFSTLYRDVAAFGVIIAVLCLKPDGLLGIPAPEERNNL